MTGGLKGGRGQAPTACDDILIFDTGRCTCVCMIGAQLRGWIACPLLFGCPVAFLASTTAAAAVAT